MNILQKAASFSQVIACIGVIPAFLGVFYNMEQQREENERLSKSMRLAALAAVNDMIENDKAMQPMIQEAIFQVRLLAQDEKELMKQFSTGKAIYYSIPELSEVGRHYEQIGAMVNLEYIDFDLVFEVITFPDDFWDSSETVMAAIRKNWNGKDKPLPDLWKNFSYLRDRYHRQRAINRGDIVEKHGIVEQIRERIK